jgi:hypothetical protein
VYFCLFFSSIFSRKDFTQAQHGRNMINFGGEGCNSVLVGIEKTRLNEFKSVDIYICKQ